MEANFRPRRGQVGFPRGIKKETNRRREPVVVPAAYVWEHLAVDPVHGERCATKRRELSRRLFRTRSYVLESAGCVDARRVGTFAAARTCARGAPALSTECANQSGAAPDLGLAETWLTAARSNSVSLEFRGMGCGCARGCAGGERARTARSGPAHGSGLRPAEAWGARAFRVWRREVASGGRQGA